MQKKKTQFWRTLLELGGMFLFVLTLSLVLTVPAQAATRNLSLNNTYVNGNMNVSGGEDRYNFTLSKSGVVTIDYAGLSIHDSYVRLYNAATNNMYFQENVWYSSAASPKYCKTSVELPAGRYYISIKGYDSEEVGTYKLRAFVGYGNTGNNTFAKAQTISRGSTVTAALTENDNVDYYKIVVPAKNQVKIEYSISEDTDTWFRVYSADKNSIYNKNVFGSTTDDTFSQVLNAGTYYVSITPYNDNQKNVGSYTLKWTMPGYSEISISSAMTVPSGVSAAAKDYKTITLRWNKVANVSGYHIYYATSRNGSYKKYLTVTDRNTTSASINNLKVRQTYYFKVQTYKGKQKSNFCAPVSGRTKDVQAVITSAKLSGKDAAVITWKKIAGVCGYEVSRKTGSNGSYELIATTKSSVLTYKDTSLSGGTTYRYAIRPKYHVGANYYTGSASASAAVTTPVRAAKYRALLIGESDYSNAYASNLEGPAYDINVMQTMLQNLKTRYSVVKKSNQSKAQILDAIKSTFKGAGSKDVSLFYYSGHGYTDSGEYSGALYTVDDNGITTKELANALKNIPGTVIVILDSCGSGAAVRDGRAKSMNPKAFSASVFNAFAAADSSLGAKSGELATSKFVVIAAAAPGQLSYDMGVSEGGSAGEMTYNLIEGVGCSYPYGSYRESMPADTNGNGKVTLAEIYRYVEDIVGNDQTTTVYPSTTSGYNLFIRK